MCGDRIWSLGSRGGVRGMLMRGRLEGRYRGRGIEANIWRIQDCIGMIHDDMSMVYTTTYIMRSR